jgi:hypothetical protein
MLTDRGPHPWKKSGSNDKNIDVCVTPNIDCWSCGMCGKVFSLKTKPHKVYCGNENFPVNIICNACNELGDEGI